MTALLLTRPLFGAPLKTQKINLLCGINRFKFCTSGTRLCVHAVREAAAPAPVASVKNFEEQEFQTVETLESGREVRVLDPTLYPSSRRSIADLEEGLVKRLVERYVSDKSQVKLGRRGVTVQVGNDILKRWNTRECVKVFADHKSVKGNMKATGAELEELTGGIVVWSSGAKLLLYRDDAGRKAREAAKRNAAPPKMLYDPYDED